MGSTSSLRVRGILRRAMGSPPTNRPAGAGLMAPGHSTSAEERAMHLILIGIGGFAWAVSRYLVDGWVTSWTRGGSDSDSS